MAKYIKNITENLIIPEDTEDRFLEFSNQENGAEWFGNGVVFAGMTRATPGYQVFRANCRQHFLFYCLEGTMEFQSIISGILKKGEILFLPSGSDHNFKSENIDGAWFMVDPDHSRWQHLSDREALHRQAQCLEFIADLSEMAYLEMLRVNDPSSSIPQELCQLILSFLDREMEQVVSDNVVRNKNRLEKAWNTVRQDLRHHWTVEKLAKLAAMSRSHYHALVHQYYQCGPMDKVRQMRIDYAKVLLLHTDHNLSSIAENIGYDSPFSFSRAFKKVTGQSPRNFRKRGKIWGKY